MLTYRIRNWQKNFEISQSRKVPKLSWVAIPNRHDGKGFLRVLSERDGSALYGCWILLVQVASKCPERGTLADEDGPLTPADIALKIRVSVELVERTLKRLMEKDIRWIEATGESEVATSALPERSQPTTDTVQDSTGHTLHNTPPPPLAGAGGKKRKQKAESEPKQNWFGLWIDINRERGRQDPLPLAPDCAAAQRLAKAVEFDARKFRSICECYLKDQDQFLRNKGHALQYLAANKYVARCAAPVFDWTAHTAQREAKRREKIEAERLKDAQEFHKQQTGQDEVQA